MKTHEDVFDVDDPRLTAYALGELEGDERAAVEKLVLSDPRAAALVKDMRTTAGELERQFAAEVVLASAPSKAKPIARAPRSGASHTRRVLLQAAGIAVMVTGAAYVLQRGLSGSRKSEPQDQEVSSVDEFTADGPASVARRGRPDPNLTMPQNPNVSLSASAKPAAGDAGFTREAIDNGAPVELLDSVGAEAHGSPGTAIGVGSAGRPAQFSSRKMAGHGAAPAPRPVARRSNGVFYDDGQDGDFRATTVNAFAEEKAHNTEGYNAIVENAFKLATQDPLSTFSIDVDTASYANVRRFLNDGTLPPVDAVRVEELINYFHYAYPTAEGETPFSTNATVASCPWAPTHKLVQVGLRARDIDMSKRSASNLVFLIDVSGSMNEPDKLPLLKRSMRLLVEELDGRDKIAMVVYAGASGLALPSTSCASKAVIENVIDSLQPQGSTNGAAGIQLAYEIAAQNRIEEGQNRVILCTDGDFNVGVTDQGSLVKLIEEKRQGGVFLSVLGFGRGNVKDSTMEMLADKGNGNYAYIDSIAEARKVLVSEMGGTLFTVAKDVKIQVEFNPTRVQAWRLIGYENRQLAHQDFNDDKKDAGEIGAGHNVTAFYEVVPVGVKSNVPSVDPLKYQQPAGNSSAAYTDELLTLKLRYKAPEGDTSGLISTPVADTNASFGEASSDFRFAASVAAFGMVLRKSANVGSFGLQNVIDLAVPEVGDDVAGYRREFVALVRKAQAIEGKPKVR